MAEPDSRSHLPKGGDDDEVEGDVAGHRVSWESKDEHLLPTVPLDGRESQWLARLHQDLAEVNLPPLLQDRFHQIGVTHAHPSAGHQDVYLVLQSLLHQSLQAPFCVARDAKVDNGAAVSLGARLQGRAVGVEDLVPPPFPRAGIHDLVSSGHDRADGLAKDVNPGDAQRVEHGNVRSVQELPLPENALPLGHVTASLPDVLPGRHR